MVKPLLMLLLSVISTWTWAAHPGNTSAVVRLVVTNDGSSSYTSGAYLGNRVVLTCYHLFADGPRIVGGCYFPDGQRVAFVARQLDPRWDQAVLELAEDPGRPGLPLATANPQVGEPVYAYGYGQDSRVYVTTGTVQRYTTAVNNGPPDWVVMTGRVDQGSSGGPILNARGEVIGNLWGTANHGEWTTVGVMTGRTRRFLLPWNAGLEAHAIKYGLYPANSRMQCPPGVICQPGGT